MFTSVPEEVFGIIALYLDDWDLVSLVAADNRIAHYVVSTKRKLSLTLTSGSNCKSSTNVLPFLTICSKYDKLSQVDLSYCYWFDEELIIEIIHLTSHSLKDLFIQGTRLVPRRLANALKGCKNLSNLSLSLSKRDYELWIPACNFDEFPDEQSLKKCVLFECHGQLKMIKSLQLYCDDMELPTLVLCFCKSLKSLYIDVNTGANLSFKESFETGRRLRKLKFFLPNLKSLTSATGRINTLFETVNLFAEFVSNVLSGLSNQLRVLWLPNLSASQYEGCLKFSLLECLQTVTLPESMNELGLLKHIRTPNPAFLSRFSSSFTLLTELSCCYDPKNFACSHKNLKILQLMANDSFPDDLPTETQRRSDDSLAKGLAHFQQLQKLSIGFGVAFGGSFFESPCTFPLLNELEYGLFLQNVPLLRARRTLDVSFFPCVDDLLTSLPQFIKLRKLTLANMCTSRYELISQVLKSCTFLQSLRLSNVICAESPDKWIDTLSEGLSQASCLEDFRFGLERDTNFGGLIKLTTIDLQSPLAIDSLVLALQSCRSLRRFAILSSIKVSFTSIIKLEWPSLVLACFVLPQCDSFKISLISSHPAYTFLVGSSVTEIAIGLPAIHYNDLVLFDSKVCKTPEKY